MPQNSNTNDINFNINLNEISDKQDDNDENSMFDCLGNSKIQQIQNEKYNLNKTIPFNVNKRNNCDKMDDIHDNINHDNNPDNNNFLCYNILHRRKVKKLTDKLLNEDNNCGNLLPVRFADNNNDDINKRNSPINDIIADSTHLQTNRIRIALGVVVRLILPLLDGVVRGWQEIRGIKILKALRDFRASRGLLTNLFAFAANTVSLSLSSVQVVHKIDPLLRVMKLKKNDDVTTTIPIEAAKVTVPLLAIKEVEKPEKCVTLNVIHEPPPGVPIRADIILIHGLHGSLVNTWKQGMWKSEGRRVKFERPPRPPIRPPKRPRHSRTTRMTPPHRSKRRRFANPYDLEIDVNEMLEVCSEIDYSNSSGAYSYVCDEPKKIEFVDDMEFSFPTFRLRLDESDSCEEHSHLHEDKNQDHHGRKQKISNETFSPCWPGDWLPLDCPGVRVIALNYTTDPYLWRPIWVKKRNRTSLTERSREMTELLIEKGVGVGHPIVWVGHSKGGIFIKQIIIDAWESGRATAAPLWRSSRGTFFYSVPHRGSPLADFNLPLLRQSIELTEIQKNCEGVLDLHRRFVALYRSGHLKIEVFSFVETALTLMSVLYLRIVGVDSADPGIGQVCGVHLDHREICKPRNRNCILYTELTKMINNISF